MVTIEEHMAQRKLQKMQIENAIISNTKRLEKNDKIRTVILITVLLFGWLTATISINMGYL